jgi:putative NADH-flavin reductase
MSKGLIVKVAVLGATGRTGRLIVEELQRRGHSVVALVRDPARLTGVPTVVGSSRDPQALARLLPGVDVVISALGPVGKDHTLHRDTAQALIEAMAVASVKRFVGVSGAGIDVPGDRKTLRDRVISRLIQTLVGKAVADKPAEYRAFAASDLAWTLVRPPRLVDSPATGAVEHHAHESCRTTSITRADLAAFLVEVAEKGLYPRQAPLVANERR